MVDIAASLSLTPAGQVVDPAAIKGAETADIKAFGNILAGQMTGRAAAARDSAPRADQVPGLPLPAGNRQPGGKILPGAARVLPDAAPDVAPNAAVAGIDASAAPAEAPAVQPVPTAAAALPSAIGAVRIAVPALKALDAPQAEAAGPAPAQSSPVPPAETAPMPTLVKMLAQAARGKRDPEADAAPAGQDAADTDAAQAAPAETAAPAPFRLELPALPVVLAAPTQPAPTQPATTQPAAAPQGGASAKAPIAAAVLPKAAEAKTAEAIQNQPAARAASGQFPAARTEAAQAQAPRTPPAARAAQAAAPSVPVLTVPAEAAAKADVGVVTVVPAQPQAVGQTATARITVAAPRAGEGQAAQSLPSAPSETSTRSVLAERAPAAETGAEPATPAVPVIADRQPQAAAAPVANGAAPGANDAAAGLPRHDFAALVDRLIEARNASTANSLPNAVHAAVNHAEFGRVTLQFQQDGKDLSVSMTSADPEFAVAVQAAMPAERQAMNADTGSRGQSQAQSQTQSGGHSSQDTAGQRGADAAADQQNRNNQGRNQRGGTETSNPSQRWAEREKPETRGGIFA